MASRRTKVKTVDVRMISGQHAMRALYLPSTPLNVLVSCAHALQQQKCSKNSSPPYDIQAELWLIDQKNVANNPYFLALLAWKSSPFQAIKIFSGNQTGGGKLSERRKNFTQLTTALNAFMPEQVLVGSDRRVEFQFALAHLQRLSHPAQGVYLDDGLYSYRGRKSFFLKDGVNALLKKLAYGFWWREPSTVGASSWVDQAWLFAPEHAVPAIQQKSCFRLEPEWFQTPDMRQFSQLVAQEVAFDTSKLTALDVMMLIPHPANIQKMTGYSKRLRTLIQSFVKQGKRIGVKYHPRSQGEDFLALSNIGVEVIVPTEFAFEFCLPSLSNEVHIIGDVGTALFTSKWLRPDVAVTAVLDENDPFQKTFIALNQLFDISVVSQLEELFE